MKVFLDTNIVMDVLRHREHGAAAATVLALGVKQNLELYITSLTLSNIAYLLRKEMEKNEVINLIRNLCKVVRVAPCGEQEVLSSLDIDSPDFEDTLQYCSALSINADVIITRNQKHFKFSILPVMDAETFLKRIADFE
jgi:predicted nucleic acid-binding protein